MAEAKIEKTREVAEAKIKVAESNSIGTTREMAEAEIKVAEAMLRRPAR